MAVVNAYLLVPVLAIEIVAVGGGLIYSFEGRRFGGSGAVVFVAFEIEGTGKYFGDWWQEVERKF